MKVKITVGTYGYQRNGNGHVDLINSESGPIDVDTAEAERLIGLGVAEAAEAVTDSEPEMVTGNLDPKALEEYTVPQLKALAKDMGLKAGGSKEELIERIAGAEIQYPVDDEDADVAADADADTPPVLSAAEPE